MEHSLILINRALNDIEEKLSKAAIERERDLLNGAKIALEELKEKLLNGN